MPRPWPEPGTAGAADVAACRAHLRAGSRTFFAASLLLPARVRAPASVLYAFCRLADDAADLDGGRPEALDRLRRRLELAYAGRPLALPVDRALAEVVGRFALPRALPEALFEGFAWDAAGRRYADLAELQAYAARVAGTVGAMMAVLMGAREAAVLARACDLGVAMQLSNIARDVGEDARAGRLYLPLRWLEEAGIDPEAFLARPAHGPALASVVRRLLDAADLLYLRSAPGIAALPLGCRPAIHAARLMYAGIGREVGRRGFDSVTGRAVVAGPRKLVLLARALAEAGLTVRMAAEEAPLPAARFLVDAAAAAATRTPPAAPSWRERRWWNLDDRMAWVIDLFERLERREQVGGSGRSAA